MPVCEHSIPTKLSCGACKRKGEKKKDEEDAIYLKLEKKINKCLNQIERMSSEFNCYRKLIASVKSIEDRGNEAIDLFIRKAHDLKKVDAQRDDVINSLCQKISILDNEFKSKNRNEED